MRKSKVIFDFIHPDTQEDYHVEGYVHHGTPGIREPGARFAEPDEPDEWEFIRATLVTGQVLTESDLSESELDAIETAAFMDAEIQDWDGGDSAMERGVKFHQDFFSNQN